eukprot:gene24392-9994_t
MQEDQRHRDRGPELRKLRHQPSGDAGRISGIRDAGWKPEHRESNCSIARRQRWRLLTLWQDEIYRRATAGNGGWVMLGRPSFGRGDLWCMSSAITPAYPIYNEDLKVVMESPYKIA